MWERCSRPFPPHHTPGNTNISHTGTRRSRGAFGRGRNRPPGLWSSTFSFSIFRKKDYFIGKMKFHHFWQHPGITFLVTTEKIHYFPPWPISSDVHALVWGTFRKKNISDRFSTKKRYYAKNVKYNLLSLLWRWWWHFLISRSLPVVSGQEGEEARYVCMTHAQTLPHALQQPCFEGFPGCENQRRFHWVHVAGVIAPRNI